MSTEKLLIVLDAAWRGKSQIQQANKDITKLAGKAEVNLTKFAVAGAAAFAAVGVAAVLAWKTIGEGAALLQARGQFENLTMSINSTADVMLGKLRDATNGMVSDANLIAGAGQIISLGLADTEDGVIRLATLVSKLGWDMQQVIMTFANNSVMRLDALGLSVEDVAAKSKILEAQGYSTDKAFDMAVIQAGEAKLALLGDTADTTAGKLQMIVSAVDNVKDAFAEQFAEELALQLDGVAEAAGGAEGALVQMAQNAAVEVANLVGGVIILADAIRNIPSAPTAADLFSGIGGASAWMFPMGNPFDAIEGTGKFLPSASIYKPTSATTPGGLQYDSNIVTSNIQNTTDALKNQSVALYDNRHAMNESGVAQFELRQEGIALISQYEDAAVVTDELTGGIGRIGVAAETAADKMARLAAETGSFFDQARRGEDFDPAEAFYSAALAAGASAAQLQQLLVTTGLETPERAQEIYDESIIRQLAQQAGSAVAGGENIDMLWQGVQSGIANPQWAQQITQQISNRTDVGGVNVTVIINGNISGEDLDMTVDNAIAESVDQYGGIP